ncbi:hypothetical protein VTI74DRAFT_6536 [Chaetomium olivicolor]
MLRHMGERGRRSGSMLRIKRKRNNMVLQEERRLPLQRPLPESQLEQPHDTTRVHRQGLERAMHEILRSTQQPKTNAQRDPPYPLPLLAQPLRQHHRLLLRA